MSKKLSFKEKNKLITLRHKEKATLHSIIALLILAVPLLVHNFSVSEIPAEKTRADDVTYRMSIVGDMMLGRHVHDAAVQGNQHIDNVFDYVKHFFDDSDYVTGNFETPILNTADPDVKEAMEDAELHNKFIHLYAEPWAVDALVHAGFDSVSLANNHALDFGDLSLQQTLKYMRDAPVDILGIGDAMNLSEEEKAEGAIDAADVRYFDVNENTRAGIIGFTDTFVQGFSAQDYVGGVFTRENSGMEALRLRITEAKAAEAEAGGGADIVIVHIHWGDEYQIGSNERQEELAYYLADSGADIIIGHHSHVLEPVTVVEGIEGNRTIVLNGMGNFVFDQGWTRTKESTLAQLDFLDDGSKQMSFVPLFINSAQPQETTGWMKPYRDFRIFRTLRKELDDDWWTVENGRLIVDLDAAGVLEGVGVTP